MRILNLPALSNSFQNPLPIKILTTYITVPVVTSTVQKSQCKHQSYTIANSKLRLFELVYFSIQNNQLQQRKDNITSLFPHLGFVLMIESIN